MKSIIKNWKTTLFGVSSILAGVSQYIKTGDIPGALTTILIGLGLIQAKDHDVTGRY